MMRLGITGANGFVGRSLLDSAEAAGWDAIGIVRTGTDGTPPTRRPVRIIHDPWSPLEWARVLGDIDVVVHLISRAHHVGEGSEAYDAYYRDNVGVSDALMDATASTTIAKVVYLSSIKAIAESTSGAAIDSNTVPAPTSVYGTTKLEAEEHFTRWAKGTSKNLVVLRPPLVYGPGVKGNFRALLRAADLPVPLPLGSIENRRSMSYLENLNEAILAAASPKIQGIHRLVVADRGVLSTTEVISVLRAALGRPPGVFRFPEQVLAAVTNVTGLRDRYARISGDLVADNATAEATLGWTPSTSTIEGLVRTALWYEGSRR